MYYQDSGCRLVFNGEIYNHFKIRHELKEDGFSIAWRGHSDTETVVESVARKGLRRTLELCEGMFALAIVDLKTQKIFLARDRLGEKPLFYGFLDGNEGTSFFFSSDENTPINSSSKAIGKGVFAHNSDISLT
mgnify:CR=1 FL=1